MIAFAINPAIRPKTIQLINANIVPPSKVSVNEYFLCNRPSCWVGVQALSHLYCAKPKPYATHASFAKFSLAYSLLSCNSYRVKSIGKRTRSRDVAIFIKTLRGSFFANCRLRLAVRNFMDWIALPKLGGTAV